MTNYDNVLTFLTNNTLVDESNKRFATVQANFLFLFAREESNKEISVGYHGSATRVSRRDGGPAVNLLASANVCGDSCTPSSRCSRILQMVEPEIVRPTSSKSALK